MVHFDYITLIWKIYPQVSVVYNIETIHAKVGAYFTVLCINMWKNMKIPFLVTKRGQNLILISDSDPRPPNCIWLYLLLSFQSDCNIENLRGGKPPFPPPLAPVRSPGGGRPQSTWFPFLLRCLVLSSCEMSTHIFTYSIYWTLAYTHNNVWNSGYWTLPHQCKSIYSILLDLHYIFYLFSAGPLYKFCALGHNRIQDWA